MIRSTKNYFKFLNFIKIKNINLFLDEYQIALNSCINYIWNNSFNDKNDILCWNIQQDLVNLPSYLDYNQIDFGNTKLSARCKSSILCQAIGIIKGTVGFRKSILNKINYRISKNLPIDKYQKRLDDNKVSKPIIKNCAAELSSKNSDIKISKGYFEYWIRIKCTGFLEIKIPIKLSKMDKKWISKNGVMLNGILLGRNYIQLRYNIPDNKRVKGIVVGCDTGIKTPAIFSNQKEIMSSKDVHGHSLESINHKLERKQKTSKGFRKAQEHRTNYINWYINRINLDGVKQVNLEDVSGIFQGKRISRWMKHWNHGEIARKINLKCEELGVQVNLQNSGYYSQRCSKCGLVRKSNRKSKEYFCKGCKNNLDADLNSSINHEKNLPDISIEVRRSKRNIQGFYWLEEGVFFYEGQEDGVPDINLLKKIE